jgi:hypothetical protein
LNYTNDNSFILYQVRFAVFRHVFRDRNILLPESGPCLRNLEFRRKNVGYISSYVGNRVTRFGGLAFSVQYPQYGNSIFCTKIFLGTLPSTIKNFAILSFLFLNDENVTHAYFFFLSHHLSILLLIGGGRAQWRPETNHHHAICTYIKIMHHNDALKFTQRP